MPRVGFERTIPAFEPAKTVHALDGSATVIVSENKLRALNVKRRRQKVNNSEAWAS
jgi:hypothetical protein